MAIQELEQEVEAVETEAGETPVVPSTGSDEPAKRQPEQDTNLDNLPQFRKWKSETDKRMAQMERNYQAQLAALQQQRDAERQRALQDMEPEERTAAELEQARQERDYYRQQAQAAEVERARQATLQAVAAKAKVPLDAIQDASSPDHAWELAWDYREKQETEKAKQSEDAVKKRQEKREANRVDLSAGKPPETDDWEAAAKKFRERKVNAQDHFAAALARSRQ